MEHWFDCAVIGKTVEARGLIFKRSAYIIALRIFGEDGETKTISKEVAYEHYCDVEVNKTLLVKMYSTDGRFWNFSKG